MLYRSEYERTREAFEESNFAVAYKKLCIHVDTHDIMNDDDDDTAA